MAAAETLISEAQSYANSVKDLANDALGDMKLEIANVGFTAISFYGNTLPEAPQIPDALIAPTLSPVNLELPAEPADVLVFQDISAIEPGSAPVLTATAPTITVPSLPAPLSTFTEVMPIINTDYAFPEPPAELLNPLSPAPVLSDHAVPIKPTIALPSFDAITPTDASQAPTDLATQFTAAYRDVSPGMVASLEAGMDAMLVRVNPKYHTQMAAIEAQLSAYLAGGTGLSSTVETAIYERAKSKDLAEARRVSRAAIEDAASRGFTLPDGAAMSGIRKSRQAASDNLARSSNEIAIKQAEMEQQNLQFAVTTSTGLRTAMLSASLSYHGQLVSINGQALDHAKSVVGMVIEVYNLQIRQFEARLSAYRAETEAYNTRLKAALSYIDLYKAEIDALQALTSVDQAKVAVYRSQIDALQSLAGVYESRIKVVVEQASLEKLKLDLFKTKVEAFTATAQAKESEYRGFSAAMSGQESLVRIFGEQVNAHQSRVAAYRADIDAKATVIRAQADTNQARATQYKAKLDGYSTVVDARGKKANLELDIQRAELNAFDSQDRSTIANANLRNDVYKARSTIIIENTKLEIETLLKNAELNLGRSKSVADLGIASAQVYQGLASAALSGMNTLVAQTLAE